MEEEKEEVPKVNSNLSESQSSTSSSSEEWNKKSFQNTTLEVSDEEEDLGSYKQKESDFAGDLNPGILSQAKSGQTYDVVRKHAVPNHNGVPNSAVPTAVQVNQIQLVNSIYNQ